MNADRCKGCLLGLALGDAFGAPREGGLLERLVWRIIGRTRAGRRRWTDDTQMALDIAQWLLDTDGADVDALARRFADSYRWSRGYGPGAARVLKRIARGEDWRVANRAVHPDGSFGNGAAMRAPVIGLYYAEEPLQATKVARASARITHAHPQGIEGAVLLASASALATKEGEPAEFLEETMASCGNPEFAGRLLLAVQWLKSGEAVSPARVAASLGNGISAVDSCVTALYLAARFLGSPFKEIVGFAARVGGDVDTIGAMAGAVWGARRGVGELPSHWLSQLEDKERIESIGAALFEQSRHRRSVDGLRAPSAER